MHQTALSHTNFLKMHGNARYILQQSIDILLSYKLDACLTYSLHTISPSVTPPAVMSTVVPSLVEIQCQLAYQMHTWTAKNWIQYSTSNVAYSYCYYSSASVTKWPQKQSQSIYLLKISWGSMPPDLPTLAYIHIRHPCNPPCKNPGYGPAICMMIHISSHFHLSGHGLVPL